MTQRVKRAERRRRQRELYGQPLASMGVPQEIAMFARMIQARDPSRAVHVTGDVTLTLPARPAASESE